MKYIFLMMMSLVALQATQTEIVHSSVSLYGESKKFTNSVQKYDGTVYGVGADIHYANAEYKLTYEQGKTNTTPRVSQDLQVKKMFARYAYNINDSLAFNINYINILSDNIAITDGGVSYALGLTYKPLKHISLNLTQYYTIYDDFDVAQSDLKLNYKSKVGDVGFKITSITKYILIDEKNVNGFTKFAKDSYLTSGLKVHAHYDTWHAGVGAYFGSRAFAIMNDGFKIQHHAMEFDRTYAVGVGKDINDFVLRVQYIYQRAQEIPFQNNIDVEVQNLRLTANYKF